MFKKLKQKVQEGVNTGSQILQQSKNNILNRDNSGSQERISERQDDRITKEQGNSHGPLIDIGDASEHSVDSNQEIPQQTHPDGDLVELNETPATLDLSGQNFFADSDVSLLATDEKRAQIPRSRTESISSQASDQFFGIPISPFTHTHMPLASDVESAASEIDESSVKSLGTLNKEQILHNYAKIVKRCEKYKMRFKRLAEAYRETEKEREKLQNVLTTSQDKAIRKISEFKEQAKLNDLAKRDIQQNYELLLEEKDEYIFVLKTQIGLLKDGQSIPDELQAKTESVEKSTAVKEEKAKSLLSGTDQTADVSLKEYSEKVKKLEILLGKCKETIQQKRVECARLNQDKEDIENKLRTLQEENEQLRACEVDTKKKVQKQLLDARQIMEELESSKAMAVAEVKAELHSQLQITDEELSKTRENFKVTQKDIETLKEANSKLKQSFTEQLEKAKSIISRLKNEKAQLKEDLQTRLETSEHSLDEEKETVVHELKRAKTQALEVMQSEHDEQVRLIKEDHVNELKKLREKLIEEFKEKDALNQKQLEDAKLQIEKVFQNKQDELNKLIIEKDEECKRILLEKNDEMRLALEERELRKMAVVSKQDEENDILSAKIAHLETTNLQLVQDMNNLKEKHKSDIDNFVLTIEENAKRKAEDLTEVDKKHEEELENAKKLIEENFEMKFMEIQQSRKDEIDSLVAKHEELLRNNSSELENDYEKQIEILKTQNSQALSELQSSLNQSSRRLNELIKENEELKEKISKNEQELEETVGKHSNILASLNEKLRSSAEDHEKLMKEYNNLQTQHKETLDGLTSNIQEHVITNEKLGNVVAELENNCKELQVSLENETKKFEIQLNNVNEQWEKKLENELQILQNECSRKVDALEIQQRESEENVNNELCNKLSEANETISGLEKVVLSEKEKNEGLKLEIENFKQAENSHKEIITELQIRVKDYDDSLEDERKKLAELLEKLRVVSDNENSLKQKLESNEVAYKQQMNEIELQRSKEVDNLNDCIAKNQKALDDVLGELNDKKSHLESFQVKIEQLATENENLISDIQIRDKENEKSMSELSEKIQLLESTLETRNEEVLRYQREAEDQTKTLESANGRIKSLEESVTSWKTAAEQKEGEQGSLLERLSQIEQVQADSKEEFEIKLAEAQSEKEAKEILLKDLYVQLNDSNKEMLEKNSKIDQLESKVRDFGSHLELQASQQKERIIEVEKVITERNERVKSLESELDEKQKEITNLLSTIQNYETNINDSLKNTEQEREGIIKEYQNQIESLQEKLQQEENNMMQFKDSVKKQFEQKQVHVKETITKMKKKFEENLADREEIHQRKIERFNKEKQKEINEAVREAKTSVDDELNFLKADLESTRIKSSELSAQWQSEKQALLSCSDSVRGEIAILTEEKKQLEEQLSNISNVKEKSDSLESHYKTTIDDLTTKIKGLDEDFTNKIENLKEQHSKNLEKLKNSHSLEMDEIRKEHDKTMESVQSSSSDTEVKFQKQLADLREKAKSKLSEMKRNNEAKESEYKVNLSELESKLQLEKTNSADLENELQKTNQVLKETIIKHEESETRLREMTENDSVLQNRLTELKDKLHIVTEKLEVVTENEKQFKMRENDLELALQEKKRKIEMISETLNTRQSERNECEQLKREIEQKSEMNKNLQNEIENLKELLETNRKTYELINAEKSKLSSVQDSTQDKIKKLQKNLSEKDDRLEEFKETLAQMRLQFDRETELNGKLKTKYENEREEYLNKQESFNKEVEQVLTEKEQLSVELKQVTDRAVALDEKVREYESQMKESNEKLLIMESELTEHKTAGSEAAEASQHTVVKLKSLVKQLKSENERTEKQAENLKKEHESVMERLIQENEERIEDMKNECNGQIKMILKEYNAQLDKKEHDFQENYAKTIENSQIEEEKLQREHLQEVDDLHKELNEKDKRLEEMFNENELQLQMRDEEFEEKNREAEKRISELKDVLAQREQEMNLIKISNIKMLSEKDQEVTDIRNQLETIKMRLEGSETESSLLENPEGTPEHSLELENMNLHAKVRQYQGEISQLKLKEKGIIQPSSDLPSALSHQAYFSNEPVLTEQTKMEYMRNVLYE